MLLCKTFALCRFRQQRHDADESTVCRRLRASSWHAFVREALHEATLFTDRRFSNTHADDYVTEHLACMLTAARILDHVLQHPLNTESLDIRQQTQKNMAFFTQPYADGLGATVPAERLMVHFVTQMSADSFQVAIVLFLASLIAANNSELMEFQAFLIARHFTALATVLRGIPVNDMIDASDDSALLSVCLVLLNNPTSLEHGREGELAVLRYNITPLAYWQSYISRRPTINSALLVTLIHVSRPRWSTSFLLRIVSRPKKKFDMRIVHSQTDMYNVHEWIEAALPMRTVSRIGSIENNKRQPVHASPVCDTIEAQYIFKALTELADMRVPLDVRKKHYSALTSVDIADEDDVAFRVPFSVLFTEADFSR